MRTPHLLFSPPFLPHRKKGTTSHCQHGYSIKKKEEEKTRRKLGDSRLKFKVTLSKYRVPENCPTLGVPCANQKSSQTPTAKWADTRLCYC